MTENHFSVAPVRWQSCCHGQVRVVLHLGDDDLVAGADLEPLGPGPAVAALLIA
nr:hypothetical protein [Amycolatopsis orientalis]